MPRRSRPPEGPFAERLDHLFQTLHPKDRGPYTPAEAAEAINSAAGQHVLSATYLWLLWTGQRDNPTIRTVLALALFFGVSPMYFFPDDPAREDSMPPELATALKDDQVRQVALRAAGLSDRSLKAIADMIDNARIVEGLLPGTGPEH